MRAHAFGIAVALVLAGCGRHEVRVHGTLVEAGKPLAPAEDDEITLSFIATDPQAPVTLASAEYNPADSTFKLIGPQSDTIPPGPYKVAICWATNRSRGERDRLQGAFSDSKSPLQYTVTDQSVQELVIDVKERTVTTK